MRDKKGSGLQQLALVGVLAYALACPWFLTDFHIFQGTQILVYAIAIMGLNLLTGYSGQISLGHGAFYAVGAYTVAILMSHDVSYGLALIAALVISFAAGYLFGLPALRLEGHYLALATFALALAIPQLLKHSAIQSWTGGVQGLAILKPSPPSGLRINADQWLYYMVLGITAVLFVGAYNLTRGRVGRALTAIRDQQVAAEAMGVNVAQYKTLAFAVSAMYTGIAGGLSAIIIQFVAPGSFDMFLSIFLFVGLVVGGLGSIAGTVVGGAFIVIVPNIAADISKAATGSVYALLLLAMMFALPNGIGGFVEERWKRYLDARAKHRAGSVAPKG